jgi:hypothetical protein
VAVFAGVPREELAAERAGVLDRVEPGGEAGPVLQRLEVGRVDVPLEEWSVCITDHHPGYVTWDEYSPPAGGCRRT